MARCGELKIFERSPEFIDFAYFLGRIASFSENFVENDATIPIVGPKNNATSLIKRGAFSVRI